MTKVVIFGSGAAGCRYRETVSAVSPSFSVELIPTRQALDSSGNIQSATERLIATADYCVICTPATFRLDLILACLERGIPALVEKPVAATLGEALIILKATKVFKSPVFVGYNLAFADGWRRLSDSVNGQHLDSFTAEVRKPVQAWRPGRVLSETVSVNRSLGGGVLLELSHEMDLALRLFNLPTRTHCESFWDNGIIGFASILSRHHNDLGSDSVSNLTLDMSSAGSLRRMGAYSSELSIEWDVSAGVLSEWIEGGRCNRIWLPQDDVEQTYTRQWKHFLEGSSESADNSLSRAACVLEWISRLECPHER